MNPVISNNVLPCTHSVCIRNIITRASVSKLKIKKATLLLPVPRAEFLQAYSHS